MFKLALISLSVWFVCSRAQTSPTPRPTYAPTMACTCTTGYTYDTNDYYGRSNSTDVQNYDANTGYGTGCTYCNEYTCSQSQLDVCECYSAYDCNVLEAWGNVAAAVGAAFLCCCICIILAVSLPTIAIIIGVVICCMQQNKRRPVQQQVVMTTTTTAAPPTDGPATATQQVQYVDQNGNPIQVIQQ